MIFLGNPDKKYIAIWKNKSNIHVCDAAKHTSGFHSHLQEMIRSIEEVAINVHSFIASFHG